MHKCKIYIFINNVLQYTINIRQLFFFLIFGLRFYFLGPSTLKHVGLDHLNFGIICSYMNLLQLIHSLVSGN